MATVYQFNGEQPAFAYTPSAGVVVMRKFIDIAQLVLHPEMLSLASLPMVGLSTFAGFASGDTLEIFQIPAGSYCRLAGSYYETVDENTSAAIEMGDGDDTNGFQAAAALNGASLQMTTAALGYGTNTVCAKGYAVADTIDALFSAATAISAKVHFFCEYRKAFTLLGADV
jgi:hypothetical protein